MLQALVGDGWHREYRPRMLTGRAYRIVTERLTLRCWQPRDAPLLKAAIDASLDHLSELPWVRAEPQSLEQKIDLLRQFRAKFDLAQDFIYGIFDLNESAVIGGTGLHPRVGPEAAEIGYWIRVERAGNGLATEAAAALTRVAFEIEKLTRVEIHCAPTNLASAAIPKKLGYTHEATLRGRAMDADGKLRDTMIWSLFAGDFPRTPAARTSLKAWDAAERRVL